MRVGDFSPMTNTKTKADEMEASHWHQLLILAGKTTQSLVLSPPPPARRKIREGGEKGEGGK